MKKIIAAALVGTAAVFAAACSGSNETATNADRSAGAAANTTASPAAGSTSAASTAGGANTHGAHSGESTSGDAPASVRAVFPDAQSITTQHKDISASQVATIERETNTKIADRDHHSYLAFASTGGARRQIGAATVVKADGKEMVVVYESRNGLPYIKEVRAEGVPQAFLDQFKGKGHDDKMQMGQDLKPNGADDLTAKAAADAIRQDAVIMQTLYGAAHSH